MVSRLRDLRKNMELRQARRRDFFRKGGGANGENFLLFPISWVILPGFLLATGLN
ncbi:unnamed protein product [Meloidogyne enterolobii]|uniref:Uncharacterized protein n=1 Tax=Meloidogyne enterolobii TaxID=390850 RepID=A0ACB1ARF5_MELEN